MIASGGAAVKLIFTRRLPKVVGRPRLTFIYKELEIMKLKKYLKEKGVSVRL